MSVLCSRIPDVALTLALRRQPGIMDRPVALLGRDEAVLAVSAAARQMGVQTGMAARQAQLRSPDITLLPADLEACRAVQDAFLAELAEWELPVEPHGLGMAYVDLHLVSTQRNDVQGLAGDLGRRLRRALGDELQPALGWDHSKFCARSAACYTAPGRMKLVAQEDEARFLAPLAVALLPLSPLDLRRLHWLEINTLGQFAALPAAAVRQQFGRQGQLAQRWAQGRDNRPVRRMYPAAWRALEVALETPTTLLPPVVDGAMAALQPNLEAWAAELQGCTKLQLELHFTNRERRTLDLTWLEPVRRPARLRAHLANQLALLPWPAALDRLVITQAQTAELPALQMTLFAEADGEEATIDEVAETLKARYGAIFRRGLLADATHPVPWRRICKVTL